MKILDLGLARFTSETREEGELTSTGQIMGTPDYIAPEQAKSTKHADIRSDIFSLGCTLFRAVTGRLPFGGDNVMEKLAARLTEDAPPLRSLMPDAPEELERILNRMLARNPTQRFQTPEDVATALGPLAAMAEPIAGGIPRTTAAAATVETPDQLRAADLRPVSATPTLDRFLDDLAHEAAEEARAETMTGGSAELGTVNAERGGDSNTRGSRAHGRRGGAQRSARVPVTFGMVMVAALTGFAWWWNAGKTMIVVEWPETERREGVLRVDGKTVRLAGTGKLRFEGGPGKRSVELVRPGYEKVRESWVLGRGDEKRFTPEWKELSETAQRRTWGELQSRAKKVIAGLEDFARLHAAVDDAGVVAVRDELSKIQRTRGGTTEAIAAAEMMRVMPWPADLLRREGISAAELRRAGGGDPSQTPAELVAVLGDSRLKMWGGGSSISLRPEGKIFPPSAGQYEANVYLWNTVTGDLIRKLPGRSSTWIVNFSGDGKRLVAGYSEADRFPIWDAETGAVVAEVPHENVGWVAMNRDGTRVLAANEGTGVVLWNLTTTTPEKLWEASEVSHPSEFRISPDDKFVAFYEKNRTVEVRDGTTGGLLRRFPAAAAADRLHVATMSITHGFRPLWKPPFISRLAAEDRCHLNGLAMEDGAPAYVTAVSRSDMINGWRDRRHEGGVLIDVRDNRIVTDQLSMPHSPRFTADGIYLLDSGRGQIARVDPKTGVKTDIAFCPGFLRGLAIHNGYAIATVSLPRDGAFAGLQLQDELKKRDGEPWCGVCIVDLRSGDLVEWIRLNGAIKELFDVTVIPEVRCPMALGVQSADIQSLISFDPEFGPLVPPGQ